MEKRERSDKYGFSLKICTRCGGTGEYSYNKIDGTRCYGCGGSGWQFKNRKVKKAYEEFQKAQKRVRMPIAIELQPGDRVTQDFNNSCIPYKNAEWKIVVQVVPVSAGLVRIEYSDGSQECESERLMYVRDAQVDPIPYTRRK